MTGTVSIIVPVYNTQRYLDKCMDSLLSQSYADMEIIIVDDGSEAECAECCDRWAGKERRIKVIHKTNEGLGEARNTGMEAAAGEYIMFVDSDDELLPMAVEKAVGSMRNPSVELCYFGYEEVRSEGSASERSICHYPAVKDRLYKNGEVVDIFLAGTLGQKKGFGGQPEFMMSAWSCIYRKEAILRYNALFVSERTYLNEDLFFRVRFCTQARCIKVLNDCLYKYKRHGNSITGAYRKNKFESAVKLYLLLRDKELCGASEHIKLKLDRYLLNNAVAAVKQAVAHEDELSRRAVFKDIKSIANNKELKDTLNEFQFSELPLSWRIFFKALQQGRYKTVYLLTYYRVKRDRV